MDLIKNNKMNTLLEKLDKGELKNQTIQNYNFTFSSYEYIKLFCETIPHSKMIDNNKSDITIDKIIKIAIFVINKISSSYTPELKKYLEYFVELKKGNPDESNKKCIFYSETIDDVFVIIHEFFHYYCNLKNNVNIDANQLSEMLIYDEAKSIISEEIVSQILKDNLELLNIDYDINLTEKEINQYNHDRLYKERKMASLYIYLYHLNIILEQCKHNKIKLNLSIIVNYFNQFDQSSIEYEAFQLNYNNELTMYFLSKNDFFNGAFYIRYLHPLSYLISLELMNFQNKEKYCIEFENIVKKIKEGVKLKNKIIINSKIEINNHEFVEQLLLEKIIIINGLNDDKNIIKH